MMTQTERESRVTAVPACAAEMSGDTAKWPLEVRALLTKLQRRALNRPFARREPRHAFLHEAVLRYEDPQRGAQQTTVYTRDRTTSHIAFLTDSHFELGQLVRLDFTNHPSTEPLGRMPCRVRRCRQYLEGGFDCVVQVGVTARKPLPWWQRAARWVGEMTGFGPDDRRGHGRPRRRVA